MSEEEQVFNYDLISEFEDRARQDYITVSDGSRVKILRTKAPKESFNGYTFVIIPGWGTIVPGWEEVLMDAIKDFNILYIESREKQSFQPGRGRIKYNFERLALDVMEILNFLKIDENKAVTVTSSFSSITMANLLGTQKIKPALNILIGPCFRFEMPPTTRYILHILPTFIFNLTKPIWRWWVNKHKSENKMQAAKYIRVLNECDPKKWRAVAEQTCFTRVWDLYAQIEEDTNVVIIDMKTDKMHTSKVTQRITNTIPNAEYIDMGTNKATHSAELVIVIRDFMKKLL